MRVLEQYEPQKPLQFFEIISGIPRDSMKEGKIADYLVSFAEERALEVRRDEYNNVLIKKAATAGYETCETLILQGHSDMVCVKEDGVNHDFEREGLKLYVEDGLIKARGTTLGADNGIALAYGLAILDSNQLPHPSLEVIFTAAEEIGMVGAKHFNMKQLAGKRMISFDSGGFTEGRIYVGCAGGEKFTVTQEIRYEHAPREQRAFRVLVGGLKGGHAGGDIVKGRGNATVIVGRLLDELMADVSFDLLDIQCGDSNNPIKHSIPDRAEVTLLCDEIKELFRVVRGFEQKIIAELAPVEDGVFLRVQETFPEEKKVLSKDSLRDLMDALILLPDGVQSMHKYFTDTPETSSNLGAIELEGNQLVYYVSSRSSKESGLDFIAAKVNTIAKIKEFQIEKSERIVGWEYHPKSQLMNLVGREYERIYGNQPRFMITHASTECGMFKREIPELDVISIGPIIYEEHTVNEYMEIFSVNELWKFFCIILRECRNL